MVVCSAYNCTGDGKALFKFPKDVALRRKWVQNVKRQNFRPTLASRLFHFIFIFIFISFEGCPSTELIYKGPSIKTLITIYT